MDKSKVETLPLSEQTLMHFQRFRERGSWPELNLATDFAMELTLGPTASHQQPVCLYFGIFEGDELVARMMLERWDVDRTLYLRALEVLDDFQNEGRGSALMEKAKELATELSYDISLLAALGERVVQFYLKHGFEVNGINPEGESIPMRWKPQIRSCSDV